MKLSACLFLALFILSSKHSFSQYLLNGSATQINCNCYKLTDPVNFEAGSVWNSRKINLDSSFDFHFNVFLGCLDSTGADGIVFILQTVNTSVGTEGSGLGFQGVSPSVGISLDTWQNFELNDPPYDHVTIQLNGQVIHGNDLAGPVPASAQSDNIEDCQWHVFRITWDATTKTLTVYFDGVFRLQAQYDLVGSVFNNDPMVYWGFSGATGGSFNLQEFCTSLNPNFTTNLADTATCIGNPVIFADQSESFTVIKDFYWDFGDGDASVVQNPPAHNYASPGAFLVKHAITGLDGCMDTITKKVYIGAKPIADFGVFDTCTNKFLGVVNQTLSPFGVPVQWTWWLDGNLDTMDSLPSISNLSLGPHTLSLAETSQYGCTSDTVTKGFSIQSTPVVSIEANNGCKQAPIEFSGQQIDNVTSITQWNWTFGDGQSSNSQDTVHAFSTGGYKTVHLTALANDGCLSNVTTAQVLVEDIRVDAGRDTSVQSDKPFTLNATATGDYDGTPNLTWSPDTGLNSIFGFNPISILQGDQKYYVTAVTDAGCTATDTIKVSVYKTPGVLVPSGFTPNGDGLNDVLRPRYNGIKELEYFAIYNRWGQLVFKTSDMGRGWDGTFNAHAQSSQTYVWIISARDFSGKNYQLKGTTTIIR